MNDLKLTQILFQEAAQSVEGSLSKGMAAVKSENEVTLFSTRRVMSQFQRMQKTVDGVGGIEYQDITNLSIKLAGDAVVGQVSYGNNGPDLCSVNSSSGVNKFGPLAYQLVMYRINPRWLRSDESLTTGEDDSRMGGSQDVWNKMYQLSKKGVYERRWLGSFFSDDDIIAIRKLRNAKTVNGPTDEDLTDYDPREDTSEKAFLDFLGEKGYQPSDFGHFWAYRLQTPDPKIQELFDAGDRLKAEIAALKIRGISPFDIREILERASSGFFTRRYHG